MNVIVTTSLHQAKIDLLVSLGWREDPADGGKTCWKAPVNFIQTPLYFALDDAYALETTGEGIYAYAGKVALGEALHAEDVRKMDEAEEKYFAETGKRHGIPPNY